MKISTKGRYALRIMIDLAENANGEYIRLKDISARQGITLKYMEQIMPMLTKAGYVRSYRGERPIMDDKYDLKKHVNFRYTEDGGASPYDYAKTPLAHDDLKIDINRLDDYELLSTEDILGE